MLFEKLDTMIAQAIKDMAHASNTLQADSIKTSLEVFRAIKTEFSTVGYNATHIPTEAQEIDLLKEMITKRRKTADIYTKAGEAQRAAAELGEVDIIMNLLPDSAKGPSKEAIEDEARCVIKNFLNIKAMADHTFDGNLMRYTKDIIAKVKEKYPEAESGIIAAVVKEYNKR